MILEFSIEGTDKITHLPNKYYFHISEIEIDLYEITIFDGKTTSPIEKFKNSSIYLAFKYISSSHRNSIQFNWGSIAYLHPYPLEIKNLVEEHKHHLV